MSELRQLISTLIRAERGQTLVEYGLILGLIAIVAIAGISSMAGGVDGLYGVLSDAAKTMQNVVNSP